MSQVKDTDIKYFQSSRYLGGPKTNLPVPIGVLNNIFSAVNPNQALQGITEYACLYVMNVNVLETIFDLEAVITSQSTTSTARISLAVGPTGVGSTEEVIPDSFTEPANMVWESGVGALVALGDLKKSEHIAIWLRRTILPDTEATKVEGFSFSVQGTTRV